MAATRAQLIESFRARGHELWLVGGALRDRDLGRDHGDADYATDALPDAVEEIARGLGALVRLVGQRYGTVGVLVGERWCEITTYRGDSYNAGSRWPNVTFGRTIAEDLARRDFTINAMAENTVTGERLDLFGGAEDLGRGIIRAVGDAPARFREDPLRILRGLRFASQLGFTVEPATRAAMGATATLLATLSQERITAELDRLLQGLAPASGLELLQGTGALAVVLPELLPLVGCEQNRFHRLDAWGHTVATVAAIDGTGESLRIRRWAALLHDVGKPAVRHVKVNGEWGFYRHDAAGAVMAATLLGRLRVGRQEAAAITLLVRRHMDRPRPEDRRSVRRFVVRAERRWEDLVALKRADNASHTYDDTAYHDALEAACLRAEREEAEALRAESPLSGDDLVAMFGRAPGPWVGRVKERLSAMVLDGEITPGDRAAAERVARGLVARRAGSESTG